jgi:hypothetical protein
MTEISHKSTIEEIAALVCQKLLEAGIETFLSGGAVVSIYTHNQYESYDLDFVSYGDRKKIKAIMIGLGFKQDTSRLFIHPNSKYFVEFPGKSMEIGDEIIKEFSERTNNGNKLLLLTPTDCVKDRLAAYIHWNDQQGLVQAVMVAKAQPVSLDKIEKFCIFEGNHLAYSKFIEELKKLS